MPQTLIHPPRTMLEIWETLPEGTLCQLINNNLVMSPSPLNIHQLILNDINVEIYSFVKRNTIGEIRIAPFDVHFSRQNIFQPDLIFIKNENLYKIKENGLFGAPDIIVEILSPSTSQYDWEDKKMIYEQYGVQEYFIVEPNSKSVTALYLKDSGYEEQESTKGIIQSNILNTSISF